MRLIGLTTRLTVFLLCIALPFTSFAKNEGLDISPIRLILNGEQPSSSIKISNKKSRPVSFQARVFKRIVTAEEDSLAETDDLVFNPPFFKIQPQQSQVIRIGMEKNQAAKTEQLYRIFFEELPPESPTNRAEVTVLMNLSIPIYIEPIGGSSPKAVITGFQKHATRPGLKVTNSGNAHLLIHRLNLSREGQEKIEADIKGPVFLPAGKDAIIPLRKTATVATTGKYTAELDTNHGLMHEEITLQAP